MGNAELQDLKSQMNVAVWRLRLAERVESGSAQLFITLIILVNAAVLGLETSTTAMANFGAILVLIDKICLIIFVAEITLKFFAYRLRFWHSPWNIFDFLVVAIALLPGAGVWSVLRSLRVLRVLRLLTTIPALRKVIAAFLHSIPGLAGVVAVMSIFFYTCGVLATKLFGAVFPEWFGTLGRSLYSLFQIMTLESWSMGIVRPVMTQFPYAWMFFVPFIVIATFTILNLFIGIIVSTMTELSTTTIEFKTAPKNSAAETKEAIDKIEEQLRFLRSHLKG